MVYPSEGASWKSPSNKSKLEDLMMCSANTICRWFTSGMCKVEFNWNVHVFL